MHISRPKGGPGASGRVLPPVTGRFRVWVAVSSHCTGEGKACHWQPFPRPSTERELSAPGTHISRPFGVYFTRPFCVHFTIRMSVTLVFIWRYQLPFLSCRAQNHQGMCLITMIHDEKLNCQDTEFWNVQFRVKSHACSILLRLFITFRRKEPSVFLQHKKRRRKTSPRVQHTSPLKHTQDRGNIVVESPSTKLHLARRTEKKRWLWQ